MGCPKHLLKHITTKNVWVNIPMDHPTVLVEGPFIEPNTFTTSSNRLRELTANRLVDTPSIEGVGEDIA